MKRLSMPMVRFLIATATLPLVVVGPVAAQVFCAPPSPPTQDPPQSPPNLQCQPCQTNCQGSPCFLAIGAYTTDATDLRISTAGFPLEVSRRYESNRAVDGPLGIGWQTSLATRVNHHRYLLSAPNTYQTGADVVLPTGWTVAFTESGNVFQPPAGRHDALAHNADGTWTYTPQKSRAALRFNADGSLASISDAFNNRIDYTYDANGRLQSVADAAGSGRTLTVTWGSDGRISSVSDSYSPARYVKYHYDPDGTLVGVDDPTTASLTNQYATRYAYTPGRFAPLLSGIKDRWNRVISDVTWDSAGKLKSYTEGAYNDAQPTSSTGEKYTYAYQPSGATKTHSLGSKQYSFGATGLITNQTTFNASGLPATTTDQNGNLTAYTYNALGNVATRSTGDVTFTYTYDPNFPNQVASMISNQPSVWPGQKYTYYPPANAAAGALKEVKQLRKNGVTEDVLATYEYNSRGQVTLLSQFGRDTTYEYNAAGDLKKVIEAGVGTTSYEYDSLGRMTSSTNHAGQTTTYTQDARDRILTVTLPKPESNSTLDFTTTYSYDHYDSGNQLAYTHVTDPNGRMTKQGYDALGHLIETQDQLGHITTYTYQYNLLRSIRDASRDANGNGGNVTTYTYNANRDLSSKTFPDGKSENYVFHANGGLQQVTDRKGNTRSYTYDAYGHVTRITYPTSYISFSWSGGLPSGGSEFASNSTFYTDVLTYDDSFRPLTEERLGGYKLTYTYGSDHPQEPLGSYTLTPPLNSNELPITVTYSYYGGGMRLSDILQGGMAGQDFHFTYAANGQYDTITLGNGQTRKYQYDLQGRLTRVTNTTFSGPIGSAIADFQYGYDYNWKTQSYTMLGQRVSVQTDGEAALDIGLTKYEYDDTYQLTKAISPSGTEAYEYDAIGNRTKLVIYNSNLPYEYYRYAGNPNANSTRLKSSYLNGPFTYDDNGNLTGGGGTVAWDEVNRPVTVAGEQYKYDYRGRRTQAAKAGIPTTMLYQGLNMIRERNDYGLRDDYIFGPGLDEPLARRNASGTWTYFAVDGLGSIVGEVQGASTFLGGRSYGAFGGPIDRSGMTDPDRFGYTGREPINRNGLMYYRARIYDAAVGRFISEDPLGHPNAASIYSYVLNNPLKYRDPLGLDPASGFVSSQVAACAYSVAQGLKNSFPPEASDKLKHCTISGMMVSVCGSIWNANGAALSATALIGLAKEIVDIFGPGNAEIADLVADYQGITCGLKASAGGQSIGSCCKGCYP